MTTCTNSAFQSASSNDFRTLQRRCRDKMRIEWTPDMDALLGTDLDKNIGLRLGLSTATVLRRRQALGILSQKESRGQVKRSEQVEQQPRHFWSYISSPFKAADALSLAFS